MSKIWRGKKNSGRDYRFSLCCIMNSGYMDVADISLNFTLCSATAEAEKNTTSVTKCCTESFYSHQRLRILC